MTYSDDEYTFQKTKVNNLLLSSLSICPNSLYIKCRKTVNWFSILGVAGYHAMLPKEVTHLVVTIYIICEVTLYIQRIEQRNSTDASSF